MWQGPGILQKGKLLSGHCEVPCHSCTHTRPLQDHYYSTVQSNASITVQFLSVRGQPVTSDLSGTWLGVLGWLLHVLGWSGNHWRAPSWCSHCSRLQLGSEGGPQV